MLRNPERLVPKNVGAGIYSPSMHCSVVSIDPIGVSAGTAAVIGLQHMRQWDAPTTAYLMVGDRCQYDCTFCAQAHSSTARSDLLSRVAWPSYPTRQVIDAIALHFEHHDIQRCCLQVTASPGYLSKTQALAQQLHSLSPIPLCASVITPDVTSVRTLLQCGIERVSLALDAACERVYGEAKGGSWQHQLELLRSAAHLYPDRIGTHLIAGLGETEKEMSLILQEMVNAHVAIGLFSFTPVRGTLWSTRSPPDLPSYRRIQAAHHLLAVGASQVQDWRFSPDGQIVSYGLGKSQLTHLLADGRAFETVGCPGCNRPYYNDRPGKITYNYPRPLHTEEIEAAISLALTGLAEE